MIGNFLQTDKKLASAHVIVENNLFNLATSYIILFLAYSKRNSYFIKKRKIKEQMKIILAQYFEIFQISSSGQIYNKNIME